MYVHESMQEKPTLTLSLPLLPSTKYQLYHTLPLLPDNYHISISVIRSHNHLIGPHLLESFQLAYTQSSLDNSYRLIRPALFSLSANQNLHSALRLLSANALTRVKDSP